MKNLVLIGGGHSHAIALRLLGLQPLAGVRLTLITNVLNAPYSGMLPGHIGGFYSFEECHIDLRRLAQFAQADLILDRAIGLDLEHQQVRCRDRQVPIDFDWLSIDIGSTPTTSKIPGVAEYTIPAKPVPQFLADWAQFLASLHSREQIPTNRPLRLGVVGGGAGGVELALTIRARLKRLFRSLELSSTQIEVHLFHRQANLMTGYPAAIGDRFRQLLIQRGIQLHLGETVNCVEVSISDDDRHQLKIVHCESGLDIKCDRIFWVTDASAPDWLKQSGLATDARGFILVKDTLQSISHPNVFATGDIATILDYPRPKAGVFAVRQGQPLADNLRQISSGQRPNPFHPQKRHLALIGTGEGESIAVWGGFWLGPSKLLWGWKDRIDHQFMGQFG